MMKLPMAPAHANLPPTVSLEQLDQLSDLHPALLAASSMSA
jgi:hypothetical protein